MFTPESRVHLASVPFDKKQQHVLKFANATNQIDYFMTKVVKTVENSTYFRKDKVIRVEDHYDNLANVNYVVYRNANFTDKWFYAFVTKLEYVNDNMTALHVETDVMQTWMFDVNLLTSFVVREHVDTDTAGLHTVPENLDVGEYIYDGLEIAGLTDLCILVGASIDNVTPFPDVSGGLVANLYQGVRIYYYNDDTTGITALNAFLDAVNTDGKKDAIVFMTAYPKVLAFVSGMTNGSRVPSNVISSTRFTKTFAKVLSGTLHDPVGGDYTPKNKKLYTHPYNFLQATNHNGGTIDYRYEHFDTTLCEFIIEGDCSANPTVYCYPHGYKSASGIYNVDQGLTMRNYPLLSWNADVFKNWLAQNTPSLVMSGIAALGSLAAGIATMNPLILAGGAMAVANQIGGFVEKSILPNEVKGSKGAGANCAIGEQDFNFWNVHIRSENLRKLDGYFEMYGYKINEVKAPNVTGRPYWNYVQLLDPNLTGDIPNEDMEAIKKIYTDGVTFWHTTTGFLNYALSNH